MNLMAITNSYNTNFDLNSLRAFIAFGEKLNFTHAAEQIHISQPALFAKIQGLAAELGFPLYRKIGQRLELTVYGERFLAFARDTLRDADAFVDNLHLGTGKQRVVLAAGEGAFLYLLGPAIKQYMRKHADLQLITGDRDAVLETVRFARADLGVASLETLPDDCESAVFHVADQMLVLRQDHPLAGKRRVLLKHLENDRLIVPPAERQHRQVLAQALQSAGVSWNVAVEASGWELMIKFVQLGLGVAVVNSICALPPGIVGKPLIELPRIHYHLFHLKGRPKTAAAATLKQLILDCGGV